MADKGIAGARLSKLGRYEVLSELGKGAMGVVYLAKDPVIGRMVAIKTIRASNIGEDDAESREFRERFVREAQTAGILSHPNIVTIHDIGEDPDTQTSFIAMEYIEGKNLKMLLAEKARLSSDQIADIIAQVGEAIDYAHRKGIIHRDIKPANIIITTDEKVKITDFGIAKVASSNLTTTGQFLGTPNYMSPEQVSGAPVDGRSDIFSLGVVLYELLTGRKPFQGDNLTAISYKIVHEDFTPPAELSPDVPPEFNPIVARAMAKDPWNRYQRGKDFALALHQLRAHLEEQKALQDLGTMVSEAEFMPTLRLSNLERVAAEGAPPEERSTEVFPPAELSPGPGSQRPTPTYSGRDTAEAIPSAAIPPGFASTAPTVTGNAPMALPPEDLRTQVIPREEMQTALAGSPPPPPAPPPRRRAPRPVASPPPAQESRLKPVLEALHGQIEELSAKDWGKLLKAQVNPPWFFAVAGAVATFWLLLLVPIFVHARWAARPSVPFDKALWKETDDRRRSLDQARKLFAGGQYEQALALCRNVLSRSPNNDVARKYAQMAEAALEGRDLEAQKSARAEQALQGAQTAFSQGSYEEAARKADEALALDGGRVEAQKLRGDAESKIAEAAEAAETARTKEKKDKKEKEKKAAARSASSSGRRVPSPAAAAAGRGAPPATAPAVANGPTALRLLFDSPISEGNVMVAVNDQILLRKQFDFRRKEGLFKRVNATGTLDVSVPVRPGPIAVKVWLSGPDVPASVLAQTSGKISGGETRVLRLEYASGRLGARIQ
jgi:serine/threonine protein kinase/tetratricopeptide (TPR) repeat protein